MNIFLAVVLAASAWTSEIVLEAEDATLIGVEIDSTREGFSGTGYVTGFDAPEDSLRFHVEAGEGIYELHLGLALSRRGGSVSLWIDGALHTSSVFGIPGGFIERSVGEHWLSEGAHTIVIKGSFDVNYLKLVPVAYDPPTLPPALLADAEATPATQALFNFLISMYGDWILAGQQELRYVDFIRETTGKEPAIAGGDLIEYSPSRWERGARPNYNQYASAEDLAEVFNPAAPERDAVQHFVEGNGVVSMEADHYTRAVDADSIRWKRIPNLGRTSSSMTVMPVTAEPQTPGGDSPHLEYRMHLFSSGEVTVRAYLSPTLNVHATEGLRYAVSIDDGEPQVVNMHADEAHPTWQEWVRNNVNVMESRHTIESPGEHVLTFWMVDPGVVLQKLVVDTGGLQPSYFGPPESFRGDAEQGTR